MRNGPCVLHLRLSAFVSAFKHAQFLAENFVEIADSRVTALFLAKGYSLRIR
jgi:hypothetical protein